MYVSEELMRRVVDIVAATFDVSLSEVSAQSSPENLPEWNSLGQLNLILALEQEFGIPIPEELVLRMQSVQEIVDVLHSQGVR
jgi:acyl carrier protein